MSVRLWLPWDCEARTGPALPEWQPLTCVGTPEKNQQGRGRERQRPQRCLTSLLMQKPLLRERSLEVGRWSGESLMWGWSPGASAGEWPGQHVDEGAPVSLLRCGPWCGLAGRAAMWWVLLAAGLCSPGAQPAIIPLPLAPSSRSTFLECCLPPGARVL